MVRTSFLVFLFSSYFVLPLLGSVVFYYFSFSVFIPILLRLFNFKLNRISFYWSNFPILFFWLVCLFLPLTTYFFIFILDVFFSHSLFVTLESFDFLSLLFSPEFTLLTPAGFSIPLSDTNSPLHSDDYDPEDYASYGTPDPTYDYDAHYYKEPKLLPLNHDSSSSPKPTDCKLVRSVISEPLLDTNRGWFSSLYFKVSNFFGSLFSPSPEKLALQRQTAILSANFYFDCLRELGFTQDSYKSLVQLFLEKGSVSVQPGHDLVRSVTEINGIKTISIFPNSTITPR